MANKVSIITMILNAAAVLRHCLPDDFYADAKVLDRFAEVFENPKVVETLSNIGHGVAGFILSLSLFKPLQGRLLLVVLVPIDFFRL